MILRPRRSIIIIFSYLFLNLTVWVFAWQHTRDNNWGRDSSEMIGKTPSEMHDLEYFHLNQGQPALSLAADSMQSLGEDEAHFERPRGLYVVGKERTSLLYQGLKADYSKAKQRIRLEGEAKLDYKTSKYFADKITYYPQKDLVDGVGHVKLDHLMPKTGEKLIVESSKMKAKPKQEWAKFTGQVVGHTEPKMRFQPRTDFRSQEMELTGATSKAELTREVFFKRGDMQVTSQKGEIFLENAHKKLKYFVLNDDVKVSEKLTDSSGKPVLRKAWAERMEGFGEDKLVLSGAPRVQQDKDLVKGYRITLREKMELLEIEDNMSDLSTKKNEAKEKKQ